MRKIDKSPNIPQTLKVAPVPKSVSDVQESIYRADDVRAQLYKDQHYKCAYCESIIEMSYNDVEHYRPKSIYYWLGHDWSNLLYSCPICNRSCKKVLFPLKDESKRVLAPGDVSGEEPLIINPANENPAIHIKCNRGIMQGITEKGQKTIDMFCLNTRKVLVNERKKLFEDYMVEISKVEKLQIIKNRATLSDDCIDDLNQVIELCNKAINDYKSADRPYSGILSMH